MATNAEANAAGFITPGNNNLISEGDDAISNNARVALDLIDAAKWDRGTLPAGSDLNSLTVPGFYGYFGHLVDNAPNDGSGTVIVAPIRTTSGGISAIAQLTIQPHLTDPQLSLRFRGSGGYSQWVRVDAGAVEIPDFPVALRPAAPGAVKAAPLALSTGHGGSQTTGTGTTVIIQHMPAMVQRVQLHLINRNPRYQMADAAPVAVSAVAIGLHNGSGSSASWTTVPGSGTTPWDSAWIDVPEAWRGKDIAVRYTWNSSGSIQRNIGTAWTGGARDNAPPLWAWLECAVPAETPVVAAYGDSLSAGVGAARPVIDSYIVQWAKTHGAFPALWAHSGDASTTWGEDDDRKWFLYGMNVAAPDALIYAMGSNEVYGGASPDLATMKQRVADTVAMIKTKLTPNVYGALIMPRTSYPDETLRRQVNTWYATNGLFRQVLDFAGAVSTDDDNLLPAYDYDGVHLTTSGYAAVAGTIPRNIVTFPQTVYDSGPRNVSSLLVNGWTGPVHMLRSAQNVTVLFDGVTAGTANTVSLSIADTFAPRVMGSGQFRTRGTLHTASGAIRRTAATATGLYIYGTTTGEAIYGTLTWQTTSPTPAPGTEAGTPA